MGWSWPLTGTIVARRCRYGFGRFGRGACAFLNLAEGTTGTSTIESKTNFLGAIRGGTVRASAVPLHVGFSTIVIETEVRSAENKLVAKVTQTQAVLRHRP